LNNYHLQKKKNDKKKTDFFKAGKRIQYGDLTEKRENDLQTVVFSSLKS